MLHESIKRIGYTATAKVKHIALYCQVSHNIYHQICLLIEYTMYNRLHTINKLINPEACIFEDNQVLLKWKRDW